MRIVVISSLTGAWGERGRFIIFFFNDGVKGESLTVGLIGKRGTFIRLGFLKFVESRIGREGMKMI